MANGAANQTAGNKRLVGIAFPFRKEKGEFPKKVKDIEAVRSDFFSLFNTPVRTRVMRPNLGTDAHALVFESKGPLLNARLQRSIRQTIFINEPRVNVLAIKIDESDTLVTATIVYEVNGIQDSIELEFPIAE